MATAQGTARSLAVGEQHPYEPLSPAASAAAADGDADVLAAVTEEQRSALLAGGKILNHLMGKDGDEVELSGSIYDAAIVMPQICRSAGWPMSLTHITIRSYMLLIANFALQLFILYMLATEEETMDKFAGQMYLCDFGAEIHKCPEGPNCIGPSGTNYQNAGRMYSFEAFMIRTYVRDSLKTVFPDKAHLIEESIDPGEYGVENYWVRYVCVFIFTMSVMSDFFSTVGMIYILYYVPTKAEAWLGYEVPSWASKEKVKEVSGKGELDFVSFKIAGMPLNWKLLNVFLIIIPKFFIWKKTSRYGVMFLMETAGIEDVIVNVTALTFILNLDEMIFQAFSHKAVHHVLHHLAPLQLSTSDERVEGEPEDTTINKLLQDRKKRLFSSGLVSWRFLLTTVFTAIFILEYYSLYCVRSGRGGYVSRAEALPLMQYYPLLSFILPDWPPAHEKEPYYTPPP